MGPVGRGEGGGRGWLRASGPHHKHLPVSSMAQPVPVGSPGHGPGSSTPPVLKADLRTQGARERTRRDESAEPPLSFPCSARASSALSAQSWFCASTSHPTAVLSPHPGQAGTPRSPMHSAPHHDAAAAAALSSCSLQPQTCIGLSSVTPQVPCTTRAAPAVPAPCSPPWHSPSPGLHTGSPP